MRIHNATFFRSDESIPSLDISNLNTIGLIFPGILF
ncbi:hypothetical protein K4L44_05165 [Halosquirtibacter laminarini]|uniref:Uncharacterized protein n=1 Tax=Halosquirtibacter laminarini TaxID=3374600 RepID=A0AC61NJQ1_9BACT|nr:hypothetical protein K4L44_05165 [Prolixibacteraceae bacterium]